MFLETAEAVSLFQTQPACLHKKGNCQTVNTASKSGSTEVYS